MEMLYKENRISIGLILILGGVSVAAGACFFVQLAHGPIGSRPAPTWLLGAFALAFFLLTLNFSYIRIQMTAGGVFVHYGVFGKHLPWTAVTVCEEDTLNAVYGWGIRFGKYKGQWVWIYNVIGGDRVAFLTRGNSPRGLIVSTARPAEVIRMACQMIGR